VQSRYILRTSIVGVLSSFLSTLPVWMRFFSRLLPASYVFEGMRAAITRGKVSAETLLWAGCLAVFDLVLASWFFGRIYSYAVRTGLIARYSAETVT